MLSLAGIPLTAGFVGKFYVVLAGADRALWTLLFVLVASSAIGLYYYLRVVVMVYDQSLAGDETVASRSHIPLAATVALGVSIALIVGLGLFPQDMIGYLHSAVSY
jgi:NADH-quinone oxidoreductase subunit N